MHPGLTRAVSEQYEVFERAKPVRIEGCPCCTSPEELAALVAVPLRALSHAQLGAYASRAITTVGTVEDFRYFWPRLAELLLTVQPGQFYVDAEILLGKLRYGRWQTWPEREQRSVERFTNALMERLRDEPLDAEDVDSWICAVGQTTDNMVALLEPLLADTAAARHNLRGFYEWNRRVAEKRGRLASAFWTSGGGAGNVLNPNVGPIVKWLLNPETSAAIGRAYATDPSASG